MGLVVLQTDQRIESDMRLIFPTDVNMHVTRIPSDAEVTTQSLSRMERTLPQAASLLPRAAEFDVVGYGCTSGTSIIGAEKIAGLIESSCKTRHVTEPVSALIAACEYLGLSRIGFLSPYVETVSDRLRGTLKNAGVETPVFGSFNEAQEERVVQIAPKSTRDAAIDLDANSVDALFLSCTNLNTLPVIQDIEAAIRKPVLSSNQVLAWHMARRADIDLPKNNFGNLFA